MMAAARETYCAYVSILVRATTDWLARAASARDFRLLLDLTHRPGTPSARWRSNSFGSAALSMRDVAVRLFRYAASGLLMSRTRVAFAPAKDRRRRRPVRLGLHARENACIAIFAAVGAPSLDIDRSASRCPRAPRPRRRLLIRTCSHGNSERWGGSIHPSRVRHPRSGSRAPARTVLCARGGGIANVITIRGVRRRTRAQRLP